MSELFIEQLSDRLKESLPGYAAQRLMEPPMRDTLDLDDTKAKEAATLLILYYDLEWKFILIKRSSHPLDKHKGQISFPGGRIEGDETADQASLREANEEINVDISKLNLIGELTSLYIPVSNFRVYPFVATLDLEGVELQKQDSEVEEILHISLEEFLDESSVQEKTLKMNKDFSLKNVPVYQVGQTMIWGATAMMLSEFRGLCLEIMGVNS